MILKAEIEIELPVDELDFKAAEVTTHPGGGYTLSVPRVGTCQRFYVGEFATYRLAQSELSRRELVA